MNGQTENSGYTILVTTEPDLFAARLKPYIDAKTLFLTDSGHAATGFLQRWPVAQFVADLRQLNDGWSGYRFLRYVRDHSPATRIFLMVQHREGYHHQLASGAGVAGVVGRTGDEVARVMGGEPPRLQRAFEAQIEEVNRVFARFAGPLRNIHTDAARQALDGGRLHRTREAYCAYLASTLLMSDQRDAFLWESREKLRRSAEVDGV